MSEYITKNELREILTDLLNEFGTKESWQTTAMFQVDNSKLIQKIIDINTH